MQTTKKVIMLKVSGEMFSSISGASSEQIDPSALQHLVSQIKQLENDYTFGIVVGGGNVFRGGSDAKKLGIREAVAHEIGMVGTLVNGRILQAILEKEGILTCLLSALYCPQVAKPTRQHTIDRTIREGYMLVFVGGTGIPYVTTDTNAALRGLQIGATEIWKGTKVDGLYDADPKKNPKAKRIPKLTYAEAVKRKLSVMDFTAMTLAAEHNIPTRIFNIFEENALLKAHKDASFGSLLVA